ncbi:hypothetical protein [Frigidibacter sp. MR17.24]|uniref:hypothetical protein n=1 Tax=Frigidibacter sp. MR17.24 TaxID=3127345 RepID=UPI003012D39E
MMMPDMPDHLDRMPTRLKLTAIRDQIDSLIDSEAGRHPSGGRMPRRTAGAS